MVASTEQEKSFTFNTRNGNPTWPEGRYLSSFVQREREIVNPVLTKGFVQLSLQAVMLFAC